MDKNFIVISATTKHFVNSNIFLTFALQLKNN
jgi:hypothetical protein